MVYHLYIKTRVRTSIYVNQEACGILITQQIPMTLPICPLTRLEGRHPAPIMCHHALWGKRKSLARYHTINDGTAVAIVTSMIL